ncbi:MAG TPA: hypothetical protein VFQ39_13935 [Longimicrobium sp.]|nr:hypothetical protein [Longimicrobium sp.]
MSDDARGFSGLLGISWKGRVPLEAALAYQRSKPDELDGTNAFSATLEVEIPSRALKELGTTLAVSGEGVWKIDVENSYSAGASITQELAAWLDVVGSAAYSVSDPELGDRTTGGQPSASVGVAPFSPGARVPLRVHLRQRSRR